MKRHLFVFLLALTFPAITTLSVSAQVDDGIENPCEAGIIADGDENNVNDACETENGIQDEVEEEPEEIPEEIIQDNNVPKGEVSPETVAGTEEVFADEQPQPAVLGASTDEPTPASPRAVLAETGSTALLSIAVSALLISSTAAVYSRK